MNRREFLGALAGAATISPRALARQLEGGGIPTAIPVHPGGTQTSCQVALTAPHGSADAYAHFLIHQGQDVWRSVWHLQSMQEVAWGRVNTQTIGLQEEPRIAADPVTRRICYGWTNKNDPTIPADIQSMVRIAEPDGTFATGEIIACASPGACSNTVWRPMLSWDGQGGMYVASTATYNEDVEIVRVSMASGAVSPVAFSGNTSAVDSYPDVRVGPGGIPAVVWLHQNQNVKDAAGSIVAQGKQPRISRGLMGWSQPYGPGEYVSLLPVDAQGRSIPGADVETYPGRELDLEGPWAVWEDRTGGSRIMGKRRGGGVVQLTGELGPTSSQEIDRPIPNTASMGPWEVLAFVDRNGTRTGMFAILSV